ncbi:c-type cytochrome, partial [Enterococcus faecium]
MGKGISQLARNLTLMAVSLSLSVFAQNFHDAPDSAKKMKNPFAGAANVAAGKETFTKKCASCHGSSAQGTG